MENNIFDFEFTVNAPLQDVIDFHRSPGALKTLTPPVIIIQEVQVNYFTIYFSDKICNSMA